MEIVRTPAMSDDGIFENIPENAYHADRGSLSVSGAKKLIPPSCPAKFRWEQDNPPESNPVFDFGRIAHGLVLGVGGECVVLDPAVHGLKKDGTVADSPRATATWKDAEAEARAAGLTPVHVDDYRTAKQMADAVRKHPEAAAILAAGKPEQSLYATDPETGVQLRGRVDWIRPDGEIDDYKTSSTANPDELERKFYTYGYFMQAAWYMDLAITLGITETPRFRFIVQEKTPPFLVSVIEYDPEDIIEGRRRNRIAINTYAECMSSGVWPGYGIGTHTIRLPRWAFTARDQAIYDEAGELETNWEDFIAS